MRKNKYNKIIKTFSSLNFLQKLDAVAERVAELETVVSGNRNAFEYFDFLLPQFCTPKFQIFNLISNVRFGFRAVKIFFGSDVNRKTSDFESETAPI